MHRFRRETRLPFPVTDVFAWHERPGALERLSPPWMTVRVLERTGTVRDGDEVLLELEKGPLHFEWRLRHRDFQPGRGFTDEQVSGPFQRWTHVHRFEDDGAGGTRIVDELDWDPPAAAVEGLTAPPVERELVRLFDFRERRLLNDLSHHAPWAGRPR